MTETPSIAFVWAQFAPYHADRCIAVANCLGSNWQVHGIEIADRSRTYTWAPARGDGSYHHETLFPGRNAEAVPTWRRLGRLWPRLRSCQTVFLCNYERPETFLLAWVLRWRGVRVVLMFDSTAADKPRWAGRERLKSAALAPYCAFLVAGPASHAYLRALGAGDRPVAYGYDTLDTSRIRAEAAAPPAPDGSAHTERVFLVVARFVAKKNLDTVLDAYGRYHAQTTAKGRKPRPLWLCGDGPLRPELEARAAREAADGIRFLGFRQPHAVSALLAHALALLLPSWSEPWGLVVNEAFAMGVPALVSNRAGAAQDLVRDGESGHLLDPAAPAAWADAMTRLDRDAEHWRHLAAGARSDAGRGDVRHFAEGVAALLESPA